jgi:hypothetical protein
MFACTAHEDLLQSFPEKPKLGSFQDQNIYDRAALQLELLSGPLDN